MSRKSMSMSLMFLDEGLYHGLIWRSVRAAYLFLAFNGTKNNIGKVFSWTRSCHTVYLLRSCQR
jgi:hypothetical protein